MNKNVRIGGVLASILVIGLIFALVGCGGGSSEAGENKPTPEKFWSFSVHGDIRQGETIEITGFNETEEIWTKYKGVVVVPTEINGKKVSKYDLGIFSRLKYLDKLIIPDASVVKDFSVSNDVVTSIVIKGKPSNWNGYSTSFDGKNLKTVTMDESPGEECPWIRNASIETFVVPKNCKYIDVGMLCDTLKELKCPTGIKFITESPKKEYHTNFNEAMEAYAGYVYPGKSKEQWQDRCNKLKAIKIEYYDVEP